MKLIFSLSCIIFFTVNSVHGMDKEQRGNHVILVHGNSATAFGKKEINNKLRSFTGVSPQAIQIRGQEASDEQKKQVKRHLESTVSAILHSTADNKKITIDLAHITPMPSFADNEVTEFHEKLDALLASDENPITIHTLVDGKETELTGDTAKKYLVNILSTLKGVTQNNDGSLTITDSCCSTEKKSLFATYTKPIVLFGAGALTTFLALKYLESGQTSGE